MAKINIVEENAKNSNVSSNSIKVFDNPEFGEVRTIVKENGSIWFVGKDVASILGYENTRDAIIKHVDESDKELIKLSDIQERRDELPPHMKGSTIVIINESGLYSLIFGSELESSIRFKRWVTSEVLPSIRRTGFYSMKEKEMIKEITYQEKVLGDLSFIKFVSDDLRVSDASRLGAYKEYGDKIGVPTPNYVPSKGIVLSATELLKRNEIKINPVSFNKLMINHGFIEERTRPSKSNGEKKFKALTEKGLKFGENSVSPRNPREVQPLYYEGKFKELLDILNLG